MVNSREQAEAVVRSTRYAPEGSRSWGPVMAGMRQADNHAWADAHVALIPMIETVEAIATSTRSCRCPASTPSTSAPPTCRSASASRRQQRRQSPCSTSARRRSSPPAAAGVVPGIHASGPLTPRRLEQGFRMITVTSDALAIRAGYTSELAFARGDGAAAPGSKMY